MRPKSLILVFLLFVFSGVILSLTGCKNKGNVPGPDGDNVFSINSDSLLIGGPLAQGRMNDFVIANDKIRVIIQNSGRYAGINLFGGNIIDIDLVRPEGEAGRDQWRIMLPAINLGWTVNYDDFKVIGKANEGESLALRASGTLDVFDWVDVDQLIRAANLGSDAGLVMPDQFDDATEPFSYFNIKDISTRVTTDYILDPGADYLKIVTTLTNLGGEDVAIPVGDFIGSPGELDLFIPNLGFDVPGAVADVPYLIFASDNGAGVSYGYFYDVAELPSSSFISAPGILEFLLGEQYTSILSSGPAVNFIVPARSERSFTRYLVVGNGDVDSVLSSGMKALGMPTPVAETGETVVDVGKIRVSSAVEKEGEKTLRTNARLTVVKDGEVADVLYINRDGTIGDTGTSEFDIVPGTFTFIFSKGTEYTTDSKTITIAAGETGTVYGKLYRAVATPGYVSGDFHLQTIWSQGGELPPRSRIMAAVADGLDVVTSTDSDFVTNLSPYVDGLVSKGLIPKGGIGTIIGQEVSTTVGDFNIFPVEYDNNSPVGGAYDYTYLPEDVIGTRSDRVQSPSRIFGAMRGDSEEKVVQLNGVADPLKSNIILAGLVTSPFFSEEVSLFSSLADPVDFRLNPNTDQDDLIPYAFGTNDLFSTDFDLVELVSGYDYDSLIASALPTWFNLLNAGIMAGAVSSPGISSSLEASVAPRTYVYSSVDPRDGAGEYFTGIDGGEIAANLVQRRAIISAGPFINLRMWSGNDVAEVGGLLRAESGDGLILDVSVSSPYWAVFDTIDIFINTDPVPAEILEADNPATILDPAFFEVFEGSAGDFYGGAQQYYKYEPSIRLSTAGRSLDIESFDHSDGTPMGWKANFTRIISVDNDSWVVVLARGSGANPSFAITNPIFIDVNGDANGDGNPFEARYVRDGFLPIH